MPAATGPKVTLFVKSSQAVELVLQRSPDSSLSAQSPVPGLLLPRWPVGAGLITPPVREGPPAVEKVGQNLPEAEVDCVLRVWKIAHEYGYRLHVVDLGAESKPRERISERIHHIKELPVLEHPSGRRLEGLAAFTEPNLRAFLSA